MKAASKGTSQLFANNLFETLSRLTDRATKASFRNACVAPPANNSRSEMESTLAILVPEAEGLVRSFRDRYDPSAKAGMPAHIILLYPFKSPNEIDAVVLDT